MTTTYRSPQASQWFSRVYSQPGMEPSSRLVALAIGASADWRTGLLRLSDSLLARRAGCDPQTIRAVAAELVSTGFLRSTGNRDVAGRPCYRVELPAAAHGDRDGDDDR